MQHCCEDLLDRVGLQVIDLGDSMDFTPVSGSGSDELTCNVADIPTDGSNLVIKVIAHLAQTRGSCTFIFSHT